MKTKLLMTAILSIALAACVTTEQAKDATDISVNAYIANEAVDSVQATIGVYSINKDTIDELDAESDGVVSGHIEGDLPTRFQDWPNQQVSALRPFDFDTLTYCKNKVIHHYSSDKDIYFNSYDIRMLL